MVTESYRYLRELAFVCGVVCVLIRVGCVCDRTVIHLFVYDGV